MWLIPFKLNVTYHVMFYRGEETEEKEEQTYTAVHQLHSG